MHSKLAYSILVLLSIIACQTLGVPIKDVKTVPSNPSDGLTLGSNPPYSSSSALRARSASPASTRPKLGDLGASSRNPIPPPPPQEYAGPGSYGKRYLNVREPTERAAAQKEYDSIPEQRREVQNRAAEFKKLRDDYKTIAKKQKSRALQDISDDYKKDYEHATMHARILSFRREDLENWLKWGTWPKYD